MKLNRDKSDLSDLRPGSPTMDKTVVTDGVAESQVRWNRAELRDGQLNPVVELQQLAFEPEWHRLWRLCRSRWRLFTSVAGGLAIGVLILTTCVVLPKYQATALIRPNQQQASGLAGLASAVLGNGSSSGGGLSSLLGGSSSGITTHDPQELIAIMQSFAFTDSLIADNHLASRISNSTSSLILWLRGARKPTRWKLYRMVSKRFDCDFSLRTGNLTMTFVDKDPVLARFILHQYIDRLRDQLRKQDVQDSKLAIKSLEAQARSTSDPLLSSELYVTLAQQMQQEEMAEMSADYAFEVIEAPVTPDEIYSPWPFVDTLVALVVCSLILLAYLYGVDRYRRLRRSFMLASETNLATSPHGGNGNIDLDRSVELRPDSY